MLSVNFADIRDFSETGPVLEIDISERLERLYESGHIAVQKLLIPVEPTNIHRRLPGGDRGVDRVKIVGNILLDIAVVPLVDLFYLLGKLYADLRGAGRFHLTDMQTDDAPFHINFPVARTARQGGIGRRGF